MGEFILKVLEILLITYFNVLSNLFNDFLVKLKVLHRIFNISEFFMILISLVIVPSQCLNFLKTLRSLFIRLDSWHQKIFNSVHQSDTARSFLLWSDAPTVTIQPRQWMIKIKTERSWAGQNKEKLTEITFKSSSPSTINLSLTTKSVQNNGTNLNIDDKIWWYHGLFTMYHYNYYSQFVTWSDLVRGLRRLH